MQTKKFTSKNSIGYQFVKIQKLKRRLLDGERKHLGFSSTEWEVMVWLWSLGPCEQRELIKEIELDAGQIARVLEKFEEQQYIVRNPIKGNRRCLFIQFTEHCKTHILPFIQSAIKKQNQLFLKNMDETDQDNLIALLKIVEQNLSEFEENLKHE